MPAQPNRSTVGFHSNYAPPGFQYNLGENYYDDSHPPCTRELPGHYPRRSYGSDALADPRKANYISSYFSNRLFTGQLSQSIELTIRDYKQCAEMYQLTNEQKDSYFINTLGDPARTFYLNNYKRGMNFEQVSELMVDKYNSNSKQIQV
eukprot:IDg9544t1